MSGGGERRVTVSCCVMRSRLRETEVVCRVVERDVSLLKEKEIPRLILDSTSLQINQILRGDYDLKIARQDYFISNQDQASAT